MKAKESDLKEYKALIIWYIRRELYEWGKYWDLGFFNTKKNLSKVMNRLLKEKEKIEAKTKKGLKGEITRQAAYLAYCLCLEEFHDQNDLHTVNDWEVHHGQNPWMTRG